MSDYLVSCCSTVDLDEETMKELNLPFLSYKFSVNGKLYHDDFGKTLPIEEFYQMMRNGSDTKTAGLNIEDYKIFFESLIKDGKDLLHITMSSGITASYQSACIAAKEVMEEYPERKIEVVDSLCICGGYGLLMKAVAQKRNEGESLDDLKDWIIKNRLHVRHWFFSTDLSYYVKGGRISKVSGIVGGIFEICPLMDVDKEGKLCLKTRVRTKKKVIEEIVKRMEEEAEKGTEYELPVIISHSDCICDCQKVKELVQKTFRNIKEPSVYSIGTTIGSHSGPGTVALFFWGKERV